MSLEDQLLLSKNGGVYYDGTRLDPMKDPILFVGLGGTGADALLRIKNEIQCRMRLPKGDDGRILRTAPDNIAFLELDTDEDVLKKTCGVASFDPNGDELVKITVDGLPHVIHTIVNKHINTPQWDWFDPDITASGGSDGAGGTRQVGRLMFCWNFQRVKAAFTRTINRIMMAAGKNQDLKIFVLTGIGGGTGSGTFLDVAFLLRYLTGLPGEDGGLARKAQIIGYIFTPDLNKENGGDEALMYCNGFAALKELDYRMSIDEHQDPFVQTYMDGEVVRVPASRPFDHCHIITARDAAGKQITYQKAMDAVGSQLFAYITSEPALKAGDAPAFPSMYDNIRAYIASMPKSYPANYHYLSVGSDRLEIPYTEITTLVAARVFEKLEPVFRQVPNRETFNFDLNALQLTYDHLVSFIKRDIAPNPLDREEYSYRDIWPVSAPYNKVFQWLNGHAQQQLKKNRVNFTGAAEKLLRPYLERLMKSPQRGPCYAANLIYSNQGFCLIKTMEGFRDDCRDRESTAAGELPACRTAVSECYGAGKNAGIMSRGRRAQEYMAALKKCFETEFNLWWYHELGDALDDFVKRLNKYYARIFKRLYDSLSLLPGIFRENVNYIVSDEEEARLDPSAYGRYLIRPLEFEQEYRQTLDKKVNESARKFLEDLAVGYKRWVGISMDEIDSDVVSSTDICGAIGQFINDNFSTTLSMNMETLLLRKAPADVDTHDYYYSILKDLSDGAVPMYDTGVAYANLEVKFFSVVSIPDDCPNIYNEAQNRIVAPDKTKSSSERSKIQWVKVQAGMPLFAFPGVTEMEKKYENAMKMSRESRRGVHLRWEWRDQLPSPLPEMTWNAAPDESAKQFSHTYNESVRIAFDKCAAAGIIVKDPSGEYAKLYVADPSDLEGIDLFGTVTEKVDQLKELRRSLWGDEKTAIKLEPYGGIHDGTPLLTRARENVLRFYGISSAIKVQAELYGKFDEMNARYTNVEQYVHALFAELIYDRGFNRLFRRGARDSRPVVLFDKMTQTIAPDYETFQAFGKILTDDVRKDIDVQFDEARKESLASDGGFNEEEVAKKTALMTGHKETFANALQKVRDRIRETPLREQEKLLQMEDFYLGAIEWIDQILSAYQA